MSGAGDIKLTKDGNVLLHEMVSSCLFIRKYVIIMLVKSITHVRCSKNCVIARLVACITYEVPDYECL